MTTAPKEPRHTLDDPARQTGERRPDDSQTDKQRLKDEAEGRKATQFDGSPNVRKAPEDAVGPQDDTPWKLPKKD